MYFSIFFSKVLPGSISDSSGAVDLLVHLWGKVDDELDDVGSL